MKVYRVYTIEETLGPGGKLMFIMAPTYALLIHTHTHTRSLVSPFTKISLNIIQEQHSNKFLTIFNEKAVINITISLFYYITLL